MMKSKVFQAEMQRLQLEFDKFSAYGCCIYDYTQQAPWCGWGGLTNFYRKLCKEADRPRVDVIIRRGGAALQIPRIGRTQKLAAPLTLVAGQDGIRPGHTLRSYKFFFHGPAAMKVVDVWLEKCRTDPVFKIILKNT